MSTKKIQYNTTSLFNMHISKNELKNENSEKEKSREEKLKKKKKIE